MELSVKDDILIVTKTDTKGIIIYASPYFQELVGYTEEELVGKPHNIIRHPKMPKAVFKLLWDKIRNKEEVNAIVINSTKNKDFYWVKANVTPSFDSSGNIIGYFSVRRKVSESSVQAISKIYDEMLRIERQSSMKESLEYLLTLLKEQKVEYEDFISTLN